MRLLRLAGGNQEQEQDQDQDSPSIPAPIFVSIDLEVSRRERAAFLSQGSTPHIKELGIAILDTRRILSPVEAWPALGTRQIETYQFSTSFASSDFHDCDFTNFAECAFAETLCISQDQVALIMNHHLQRQHGLGHEVVLVGHSIHTDLKILRARGVDLCLLSQVQGWNSVMSDGN